MTDNFTKRRSQNSFTTDKLWRDSGVMDELEEEEQLSRIYATRKTKTNSNRYDKYDDDTISHSRSLSFASGGILAQHWRQIKCYVCFKVIMWLFVGIVIFWQCMVKQDGLTGISGAPSDAQKYCCDCHDYAKNRSNHRRVDWSYCTKCIDCTKCDNQIHNETYLECDGVNGIYHKNNECHLKYLSDTTMVIFYKNYHVYGWGALVICLLYVGISLTAFTVNNTNLNVGTIGMLLMVYNVVVAMTCFYMIYKPYQYHQKYINGNDDDAYCYVDTLGETLEDMLTVFVFGSLILLLLQWLFCCCKCFAKCKRKENLNCVTSEAERWYILITVLCGLGFFATMFTAVGILIHHHIMHRDIMKIIWLLVIDCILIISCIDIFCCPFCKERVRECYKSRNRRISDKKYQYQQQENPKKYKPYNQMTNFDTTNNIKEGLLLSTNNMETNNRIFETADNDDDKL